MTTYVYERPVADKQIVYIVEEHIEYQGDITWGVFDSEEKAEAKIKELYNRFGGRFDVKEWEVN